MSSPRVVLASCFSALTLCLACGSTVHEATGGGGSTATGGSTNGTGGSGTAGKGTAGSGTSTGAFGGSGTGAFGGTGTGASAGTSVTTGKGGTSATGGKGGTGGTGLGGTSAGGTTGKAGSGGSFGGVCKSSADCPSPQQCNLWDTGANVTRCSMAVGGKAIGQPCGSATECMSGMCFNTFTMPQWGFSGSKTCSVFCKTDGDCGLGNLCVDYVYPGDVPEKPSKRQCMKQCTLDNQCPATNICAVVNDATDKRFATVCNGPEGAGTYGADASQNGCQTSMITKTFGGKVYCSRACATQSDCPPVAGNAVSCVGAPYVAPDKSYTTPIQSCF